MRVKLSIVSLFLFFYLGAIQAQIYIHGSILDKETLKPLPGCSVVLMDSTNNIVKYCIADAEGHYSINLSGLPNQKYLLEASILGYSKQSTNTGLTPRSFNFVLEQKQIELKEVKITAPKISQKGDTINYNISSFKDVQDRVIGDVLKKIPGIDVKQDGTIAYNGKAINKFYIEGMDLLEGKYNMATNNIPADAVASVQVFENHQDIKTLQDKVFSDQAALNLKLTDIAKANLLWKLDPGIGMNPLLWDAGIFSLQLMQKIQGLSLYKTNNCGTDITNEIKVLTMESLKNNAESKSDEPDLVSVPSLASPDLSSKKILFNNSHVISTNNLVKLKNDYQLRITFNYLNSINTQTNANNIKYFGVNDSDLIIRENYKTEKKQNSIIAGATLIANKHDYYLNNSFNFKKSWNSVIANSAGNNWAHQQSNLPFQSFKNDFNLIKTHSQYILQIHSLNFYNSLPQNLSIYPGLYAAYFNLNNPFQALQQKSEINSFFSNTTVSVKTSKGRWSKEYLGGFIIETQTIKSSLKKNADNTQIPIGDTLSNNYNLQRFQYKLKPGIEYFGKALNITMDLPIICTILKANNIATRQKEIHTRFAIMPKISFNYKVNPFWSLKAGYGYSVTYGDIHDFAPGYMLHDYRTLSKNSGIVKEQKRHILSAGIFFKNPIKAVFSSIYFFYIPSTSNTLMNTKVEESLTWQTQTNRNSKSKLWMINGQVSKILDILPLTIWLDASLSRNNSFTLFQNVLSEYAYLTTQIKPKLHLRIASWTNVDYEISITRSQISILSPISKKTDPIHKTSHKLSYFLNPSKKVQSWVSAEYLKIKSASYSYPENLFIDSGICYQFKRSVLSVEWRNILNITDYSYSNIDDISINTSHYQLRPSEILFKMSFTL